MPIYLNFAKIPKWLPGGHFCFTSRSGTLESVHWHYGYKTLHDDLVCPCDDAHYFGFLKISKMAAWRTFLWNFHCKWMGDVWAHISETVRTIILKLYVRNICVPGMVPVILDLKKNPRWPPQTTFWFGDVWAHISEIACTITLKLYMLIRCTPGMMPVILDFYWNPRWPPGNNFF